MLTDGHNICDNEILDELDYGSKWTGTTGVTRGTF